MTTEGIIFQVLTKEHINAVIELACNEFVTTEQLNKILQKNYDEAGKLWMDVILPSCIDSGLSVVAVDTTNGKIVGFQLSAIVYKGRPDEIELFTKDPRTKAWAMVYKILQSAYMGQDVFSEYDVDVIVNIMALSVCLRYRNRGIATMMASKALNLVRSKNLRTVTVETSSRYSRRLFEKMGFRKLGERKYEDISVEEELFEMTDELRYHHCVTAFVKTL